MSDIKNRARELLAAEFEKDGYHQTGGKARDGYWDDHPSIRAIIAALTPPDGYVLVRTDDLRELCDGAWEWHVFCEWPADVFEQKMVPVRAALDSINARPEVK